MDTLGATGLYETSQTALSCAWRVKVGLDSEDGFEIAARMSKPLTVPSSRLAYKKSIHSSNIRVHLVELQ